MTTRLMRPAPRRAIAVGALLLTAAGQGCRPGGATPGTAGSTPATYRDWRVEPFGPVASKTADGAIDLEGTTAPAGLFFRKTLGPDRTYRLTLEGHPRAGQTTVRLTLDDNAPRWFPAPDGRTTITVSGNRLIEVVVYSDKAYAYHLGVLEVQACSDCRTPADVLTTTFSGWKTEPFGPVEWVPAEPGVRLRSLTAPGGIIFRRPLDPTRSYRLAIGGQPITGQTTTRLTFGAAAPEWLSAPDGRRFVNVSGINQLEVVVYSDTPYSYNLRDLTLDECPDCLTDARLRDRILADVPSLKDHLNTDALVAARELLNWVANTVDISDAGTAAVTTPSVSIMSAGQALQDVWLADTGGTACAGFASFFSKVLTLFGYRAFTIDVGYAGSTVTHVTNVLIAGTSDRPLFYILDPTFNGTYVDRQSGAFLSLDDVLGSPAGRTPRFRFQTQPLARDYVYAKAGASELSVALSAVGLDRSACVATDAGPRPRYVCKRLPYDSRALRATWKKDRATLGIPADADLIVTLLRHRVFSASTTDAPFRQRFLELLARHGIPFGPPGRATP